MYMQPFPCPVPPAGVSGTEWRRPKGCRIFTGFFWQQSHIISCSYVKRHLQLCLLLALPIVSRGFPHFPHFLWDRTSPCFVIGLDSDLIVRLQIRHLFERCDVRWDVLLWRRIWDGMWCRDIWDEMHLLRRRMLVGYPVPMYCPYA